MRPSCAVRTCLQILPILCLLPSGKAPCQTADIDLNQQAVVATSEGTFVLSFYQDKAPRHVRRFLALAASGAYDGGVFHHVIKWGIVQAGPVRKPAAGAAEFSEMRPEISSLSHVRGTLSAIPDPARSDVTSEHFFVCASPQQALDGKYTAFGFVAEGIEVIDRISELPADASGAPVKTPVIERITLRPPQPAPPLPFSEASPEALARYRAVLETALGNVTIEFLPDLAPNHVRNFLRLAQAGFYDGTAFHRVARNFVVQGGLLSTRQPALSRFRTADLVGKLKAEFNSTRHVKGIVSMARFDDPDSAETSFFICLGAAGNLDGLYTVFGRVVEGIEVLDRFQEVEVEGETPRQRIELRRVRVTVH